MRSRVCVVFVYRALTFCGTPFQDASTNEQIGNSVTGLTPSLSGPTTPNWQRWQAIPPVRFRLFRFRSPLLTESLLLSFPTGYLDVSVHLVPSTRPMCSGGSTTFLGSGFPHSDIPGSKLSRQLPEAFRSHSRPSSVVGAKASAVVRLRYGHLPNSLEVFLGSMIRASLCPNGLLIASRS